MIFGVGVLTWAWVFQGRRRGIAATLGDALLDRNGLVGILFYWSLVGLGAGVLNAQLPISAGVLVTVAVVTAS